MEKWSRINSGVKDLWLGTALLFIIYEAVGLAVAEHKLDYTLGLIVGSITTVYLVYHMYESIDAGLSMDAEAAAGYMRNRSIVRWLIRVAVAVASVYIPHVSVVGVMLGMIGLKFSAYLQPVIHRLTMRSENRGQD